MGGIKKKLQRLFGGGNRKRERRGANLSDFAPENQGLGGEGLTGLGMTQAGTDLGDWGNGAILDELQPPPVPERRDRPQLTTARRDNPIVDLGGDTGLDDDESSLESSSSVTSLVGDDESSLESSSSVTSLEGDVDFELNSREDDDGDLELPSTLSQVARQDTSIPQAPPPPPSKYGDVKELGGKYKGENERAKWLEETDPNNPEMNIEYLNDEQRKSKRLQVDDQGRLTKGGQVLTSGTLKDGKRTGGMDLFTMNPEGDLLSQNDAEEITRLRTEYQGKLDEEARALGKTGWSDVTEDEARTILAKGIKWGWFNHSSLVAGGDVAGAGLIRVVDGVLKLLTPESGHYKPGTQQTVNTLTELKERGANLDHARVGVPKRDKKGEVKHVDPNDPRSLKMEYFHPNEILESQGDEKTLMGKKRFLGEIDEIGEDTKPDRDSDPDVERLLDQGVDTRERARGILETNRYKRDKRLKKEGKKLRPQPQMPEPGPEEFLGRSSGKAGSEPTGPKKYDDLVELGDQYKGEHEIARWRMPEYMNSTKPIYDSDERKRTAALTDEGRAKRRLHVGEDGLCYDSGGLLMDTSDTGGQIREDMDEQSYIYAMDETGDILVGDAFKESLDLQTKAKQGRTSEERDTQYFHHSSFFGGRKLGGAGGMQFRDGKAVTLSPNSGHHHAKNEHTFNVFDEFMDRGVDITDLKIDYITKHKGTSEDRKLGGKRMQYLSAGAVRQALGGTPEERERAQSQGQSYDPREKAKQRLDQQVDLLDEVKHVRHLAGSDENTRALELQMLGYIYDGAQEPEIVKYVESQGYEVLTIDVDRHRIEITNPNVSPSRMRQASKPGDREPFEKAQSEQQQKMQALRDEKKKGKKEGTWSRDVDRLPEWAKNDVHEDMRKEDYDARIKAEKKRKKKEEEERIKAQQQKGGGYGGYGGFTVGNYNAQHQDDDQVVTETKEERENSYKRGMDPEEDEQRTSDLTVVQDEPVVIPSWKQNFSWFDKEPEPVFEKYENPYDAKRMKELEEERTKRILLDDDLSDSEDSE